jgi:hypothetical protein
MRSIKSSRAAGEREALRSNRLACAMAAAA